MEGRRRRENADHEPGAGARLLHKDNPLAALAQMRKAAPRRAKTTV